MNAHCQTADTRTLVAPAPPHRVPLTLRLARLLDRVLDWRERAHQRRQLSGLPDYILRDIGLSQADVEREVRKPFWMP